jgi:hypothetical protein
MTFTEALMDDRLTIRVENDVSRIDAKSPESLLSEIKRVSLIVLEEMDAKSGAYFLLCVFRDSRFAKLMDALFWAKGCFVRSEWWLSLCEKIGNCVLGKEFSTLEKMYAERKSQK